MISFSLLSLKVNSRTFLEVGYKIWQSYGFSRLASCVACIAGLKTKRELNLTLFL